MRIIYKILQLAICSFILLSLGGCRTHLQSSIENEKQQCFDTSWPQEKSDLVHDESVSYNRLDNGFRYVTMTNIEPLDRVALYLFVGAGSLNENESQLGTAHFLEHMVFNGTDNFPPGELIKFFQSIGMDFGGDTNAHTSFDETVYKIFLPNGGKEDLIKGVEVLADFATEALLQEAEVTKERGVILAEKRTRNSVQYQTHILSNEFTFNGTLFPKRLPIGDTEIISTMTPSVLNDYYQDWYRPENMVLFVVGDFKPDDINQVVEDQFSHLRGIGKQPECINVGHVNNNGLETFYHHEKESGITSVTIETVWNKEALSDSYDVQKKYLLTQIATRMVNLRIQQIEEQADTPFTRAGYYVGEKSPTIGYGGIFASTDPDTWELTLSVMEKLLRQIQIYGFTEKELISIKEEILSEIENNVNTAGTRNSRGLINQLIRHVKNNRVFQSPQQELDLLSELLQTIELKEVNETFQAVWLHDSKKIKVTGNAIVGDDPNKKIKEAFISSSTADVEKYAGLVDVEYPYLPIPQINNKPTKVEVKGVLGIEDVYFENGTLLHLKKTTFKEKEVLVALNFGHGKIGAPTNGVGLLGESVVNNSGTGKLNSTELTQALLGSSVNLYYSFKSQTSIWNGYALNKDVDLLFQSIFTVTEDPGLRETAYNRVMQQYEQKYKMMNVTPQGAMHLFGQKFLVNNDDRIGLPSWKELSGISLQGISLWYKKELSRGPYEISVVGDFKRDEIVDLVGRYFGSKKLYHGKEPTIQEVDFPDGQKLEKEISTSIEKSLVAVRWPIKEKWEIGKSRRLDVLASMLEDKVRELVREKLGAVYSPSVAGYLSRVYPKYGYISTQLTVEPGREKEVISEVLLLARSVASDGFSDQDLLRTIAPKLTSLKDIVKSNNYWLNSVLRSSGKYPEQYGWAETMTNDYRAISKEEINEMAMKYLNSDSAARVIIRPEKK